MSKNWLVFEPVSDDERRRFPEIDPVILQLLWNRGIREQKDIDVFLGPDWSRDTYSPKLFLKMEQAVSRVFQAFEREEVITVHGDYDADGVCGTAIVISTLRDICREMKFDDKKITSYLPHREKEGYGLSIDTIDHLRAHDKTSLLVTVDCGISNKAAIDRGSEIGIDTIVCDHHAVPDELPDSAILIHPLVIGETFPNKHLCGAGVAFKFASALISEARRRGAAFPDGYEKWLLDLVAIATVTDIMPLTGENRVLEHYGLLVLNKTRRKGIQKLLEVAGSEIGTLDTVSIGFQIGPRLNAAGRMTHANIALELLLEEDDGRATQFATQLHTTNIERQKASLEIYELALEQVKDKLNDRLMLAVGEGWPSGLVGLVAGKLANEFHVPAFVIGKSGDQYVGSGRSIEGYNITDGLRSCAQYLDKFGGHPQACGFSIIGEVNYNGFVNSIQKHALEHICDSMLLSTLCIDAQIDLEQIQWELSDQLQTFRPFGIGNPTPKFVSRGLRVISFSSVGKDEKHLRLRVQSRGGRIMNAIGFGLGKRAGEITLGSIIDVVYEISVNEWNGNRELQLKIEDINKF